MLVVKFNLECTQNHVWGPLGFRDVSIFVKHKSLQKSVGIMNMAENSIENYIEWYSQNTKRMNVGSRVQHIMI